MDYQLLRALLANRRDQWDLIARVAGLNRRTIMRIVSDKNYNTTLATVRALEKGLKRAERKAP